MRNFLRNVIAAKKLVIASFVILFTTNAFWGYSQPWTYDFGTGTGTANNSNSGSGNTSFFTSTPSGGGTYRVRIGTGGGSCVLANPGTSLGTSTEAQLIASTSASTNKFGVSGWSSPSTVGYLKAKIRTTSSGNGVLNFSFGIATLVTDNNGYTSQYNNSLASFKISYTSGAISGITRRTSGSDNSITGSGFAKDTDHQIEVYANNASTSTNYSKNSTSYSLSAQQWDLWVDGVKVSPSNGWAKAGTLASNTSLDGFGFFSESSASNTAVIYVDDLEYSNTLPTNSPTLIASVSFLAFSTTQSPLTNSVSQSFNLSGTFLTGAPGNITVTAPNTDFQVSNDDATWGASTQISYTSATLSSTLVYVRFTPQSSGSKSGNVSFSGGGVSTPPTIAVSGTGVLSVPSTSAATNLSGTGFNANWSSVGAAGSYNIDVSTLAAFGSGTPASLTEGFNSGTTPPSGWTFTGSLGTYTSSGNYGNSSPSLQFNATNQQVVTPMLSGPSSQISFWLKGNGTDAASALLVEGYNGTSWVTVQNITNSIPTSGTTYTYNATSTPAIPSNIVQFRFTYTKSAGNIGFDDINIDYSDFTASFVTGYNGLNVGNVLTYSVSGLTPNTTYYYRVRASDVNGESNNSNVISVTTPATFRTTGSGSFSSVGSWEYLVGTSYVPATQVPATIDDITVQSGHVLTLDQNFTVGSGKSFIVAIGGSLVIADNTTLDMADNTGTINFNGQSVTVKSTSSGTGSIGQIPGTLSGATNVTLERFIPQNATRGWRLLAANTSGQTIRNAWQEGGATVSDLGTQITGASTLFANDGAAQSAGFDKRTPGSSILFYDQPNDSLNALASTNVNIATHPAYFLYIRGDRSGDFTTNATVKATTLRSTGTIVSGNQVLNVLPIATNNTNGFNILGNPFASAIDMRTVMATRSNSTDISENFQVWDPKVLGTYGLGGFQTFTRSGANYVVTPGGGSYQANNGSASEYNDIESGAGFVVTNTGGSTGTITIAENAKVSASREVQRPAGTLAVPGLVKTNLYAMNTGSPVLADGNLVLVDDSYSNNVDIADARKIPNFGENFGIEKSGNFLAVEKRQAFVESDIIAFSMSKLKAVAYRLEITTEAVDAGLVAYLDDSYTKIQTPLSNQGTSTYDFTVTSDAASAAANRFQIVFKSLGGALPVSFIKFAATKANNDVVLEWKVGNQQGVSKYEVEKSTDGRTFVTMASVSAVDGQDVYSWTDNNVIEPKLYYRVKAVEADGSSKLTDIASIVTNKKAGIKLVTNLARANEAVKLEFVGQQAGKYNIRLVNSLGQVMYRNFISYVGGSGYQQFTIPSQLAGGAYQLEIVTPGKTKSVQRLVIQ